MLHKKKISSEKGLHHFPDQAHAADAEYEPGNAVDAVNDNGAEKTGDLVCAQRFKNIGAQHGEQGAGKKRDHIGF